MMRYRDRRGCQPQQTRLHSYIHSEEQSEVGARRRQSGSGFAHEGMTKKTARHTHVHTHQGGAATPRELKKRESALPKQLRTEKIGRDDSLFNQ
jgi:hypothetical protein